MIKALSGVLLSMASITQALDLAPTPPSGKTGIWANVQPPAVTSQSANDDMKAEMDQLVRELGIEKQFPGLQVAVTKKGNLIYSGTFGFAKWNEKTAMQPYTRNYIGSTSKVLATMGMMKISEDYDTVELDRKVYGSGGILTQADYSNAYKQGVRRFHPIAGVAIGQGNSVITWYRDGNYTVGNSSDLQAYATARSYKIPSGQTHVSIVGVARGGTQNHVYAWYRDGSYSVGTPSDLGSIKYVKASSSKPAYSSRDRSWIIGIAAHTQQNIFYAYYHDGRVTSGDSPENLRNRWDGDAREFELPSSTDRYNMVGVGRSNNNVMVTWFSNGKAIKGNSINLASILAPYNYTRRTYTGSISQWLNAYKNMEIRHLLSHTSGFTRSGQYSQARVKYNLDEDASGYQYSNKYVLSTRPLLFKPGSDSVYSNHGMGLVGHLIEEITGQDWYAYLRKNIFQPAGALGISAGGLNIASAIDGKRHTLKNGSLVTVDYPDDTNIGSAAGSIRASAVDLARVLVATDKRKNYPDVLKPSTLDLMESRPFPGISNFGLGWGISCQVDCIGKRLSHSGLIGKGSASYFAKYHDYILDKNTADAITIDDITVSVIVNRDSTSGLSGLATKLARIAAAAKVSPRHDLFPEVTSYILPVQ